MLAFMHLPLSACAAAPFMPAQADVCVVFIPSSISQFCRLHYRMRRAPVCLLCDTVHTPKSAKLSRIFFKRFTYRAGRSKHFGKKYRYFFAQTGFVQIDTEYLFIGQY